MVCLGVQSGFLRGQFILDTESEASGRPSVCMRFRAVFRTEPLGFNCRSGGAAM